MSGRKMKKTTNPTNKKPSLHLCLFHPLSGNFGPSDSLLESTVCLTCIKQSNHSEMIENAFKCSELEQLSGFGRSTSLCNAHQIRAYQMKENFTGC